MVASPLPFTWATVDDDVVEDDETFTIVADQFFASSIASFDVFVPVEPPTPPGDREDGGDDEEDPDFIDGMRTLTFTITDNDEAQVMLSVSDTVTEGESVTVTATLSNLVQKEFTLALGTRGTATAGSDYTEVSEVRTFGGDADLTQTWTI